MRNISGRVVLSCLSQRVFLHQTSSISSSATSLCILTNNKYFSTNIINLEKLATKNSNSNNNNFGKSDYWYQIVSDAEKNLIKIPPTFKGLKWLLSEETSNVALHIRKLVDTTHPLLKTAKLAAQHIVYINDDTRHLLYGKNHMLPHGLVVLLLSKAAGHSASISDKEIDLNSGILHSQKTLAEITVMIRISHMVHQGLVNLQPLIQAGVDLSSAHSDMTSGNQISLLSGDYLVSSASAALAALRNQELNELISSSVRDMAESEFIGDRDEQNNPLPSQPRPMKLNTTTSLLDDDNFMENDVLIPMDKEKCMGIPEMEWTLRNILYAGSLLSKSCQGVLKLAQHPDTIQKYGYLFGKHLALAWQACIEMEPFNKTVLPFDETFSLVSGPVLYHLQYDPTIYQEIKKGYISVDEVDFVKLHKEIMKGPGPQNTKNLQKKHTIEALNALSHFPPSDARLALENLVNALQE